MNNIIIDTIELNKICNTVRELIGQSKLRESEEYITQIMMKYPHNPEPHNLMGIQLENCGDHLTAMKHFRAAWALDPSYLPARYNMEQYADMSCNCRRDAYTEEDCIKNADKEMNKIEYDASGTRHIVKRDQANSFGRNK